MWLTLDKQSPLSLNRQISSQIRTFILRGDLPAGHLLPSTRQLGKELDVARSTVLEAYDQLLAEGYLESRSGSGTRVAQGIRPQPRLTGGSAAMLPMAPLIEGCDPPELVNFQSGIPALEQFPAGEWGKLYRQCCESLPASALRYCSPAGVDELREAISGWLLRMRGLRADPGQIMITTGATQGLRLVARLLNRPKALALVEDPVHRGLVEVIARAGYEVKGIAADAQGMDADQLHNLSEDCASRCAFIYVTPSHQYPTGGILSAPRRQTLVNFAHARGCMLVEDDYDGEFRFEGTPVSAMRELAPEKVIYIGSFSKILAPALRIGFAVVPAALIPRWIEEKQFTDVHTDALTQRALASFISSGTLERHIWKMCKLYKRKRQYLLQCLRERFGGCFSASGQAAGLHMVAEFPEIKFTEAMLASMRAHGVRAVPVEHHSLCRDGTHAHQLILGYAHLSEQAMERGVDALHAALRS
ncbi:MAG: PLP-dependent aminotransferase family protein [Desulfovibrio sp.]|uniref:MocR-like pyridoxine biosynthesis transcription factor PdxR n=1 Tax=Desulfovibrio sp. TaxID=885 RepID=UPI00135D8CED|nr:PLP-dependent aminotransferase family protein [Desulfovibrio sp.]MTJ91597.1 PLP-dependent aminotransferase family protein [Desulfovibrio sp.]